MDISRVIFILEALASGCSPLTGEALDKESVLNERDVIRALQIAIGHLETRDHLVAGDTQIDGSDIKNAIDLFKVHGRNPSSNSLTGFFLGTRHFKNQNLTSNKLYGKFRNIYTQGQLIDFFSQYLAENNIITNNNFRNYPYSHIDFFQKEKFSKLTSNAINQLKEKVKELGILKTENLADYVQEARNTYARAYEPWSEKEMELLSKAIRYTNDLNLLSECFQRGQSSIEKTGQKLIFSLENEKKNT